MPAVAQGTRDSSGKWHPDNLADYPPLDIHGILPWSVLRQDSAPWQARKKQWAARDVDDLAPRASAAGMMATGSHGALSGGVSRFDPVLAELCYSWFCPAGGTVLDPYAGGPVRGIVAAELGHRYTGVDLSSTQVAANRAVAEAHWPHLDAGMWAAGDAATDLPDDRYDYVLTCPPYWNRERYSDNPADLSAMTWPEFLAAHREIAHAVAGRLRDNRFCTWVISDIRDSKGHLRRLPALVAEHLESAGLRLCNEQILIAPAGTAAKRMRVPWEAARTTTRTHQLVLTFVKGDRREAAKAIQC